MPTTSNFGWTTPADTDLVKDGAAAIRTLGNGIDTSLVDLKGGTTGQILSKASNTDLDYTWIANDQGDITEVQAGTGISVASGTGPIPIVTNTVATEFDAKGDLVVGTGADTFDRLAAGNNGETLVADSSATTGLRWQANVAAGRNAALNGGQDIWQRGTSFTTTAAYVYCSDRWYYSRSAGNTTVSRQTDAPSGFQYSIRLARNSGDTNTSGFTLHQALETSESMRFAGQTVTFSFWAKAGANYSAGAIPTYINTGTGTDQAATGQNAGTWTGFTSPLNGSTFTPTTSWVRYSFTATIGSTATQIGFGFITPSFSGTAGANDWVQFTGLQFELGSVATNFSRAGATLAGELAACQRYYFKTTIGRQSVGYAKTTTTMAGLTFFPVEMRIAPTALEQSGTAADYLLVYQNTATACSAVPTYSTGNKNNAESTFTVASGLTAGNGVISGSNAATSYLAWSAEL